MDDRTYIAIDLKSFYASVECIEHGLDPMTTNLVVADASRTQKTICLAVTPSLRSFGIPGRARLFQVVQKVREVDRERMERAPGHRLTGKSFSMPDLLSDPSLSLDYLVVPPRMALYMDYSARIYKVYMKYVAPEDIHVYSIDEVFMDVTAYLGPAGMTAPELARRIILDVQQTTGVTATAGIGPNLYLAKVAMDIMAKHSPADENGVRVASLDELSYRRLLWSHRPLTDFWRVGKGYARRLESRGLYTMGDVARCSIHDEDLLYDLFGVNAELLIDHAWGWEPCTIADIKAYSPEFSSVGSGQVLQHPYSFEMARLVAREMADQLGLELVEKRLVTDRVTLTVGYDIENLSNEEIRRQYRGPVATDSYGRKVPKAAHGTAKLDRQTSSSRQIMEAVCEVFDKVVDSRLLVRRMTVVAERVADEKEAGQRRVYEQLDLFTDPAEREAKETREREELARERKMQETVLDLKRRFGKNAVFKGLNLKEGATAKDRNGRIGGHRA